MKVKLLLTLVLITFLAPNCLSLSYTATKLSGNYTAVIAVPFGSNPSTFNILRDYPLDYDGNGLYDAIILELEVNVNETYDDYQLYGELEEIQDDNVVIGASYFGNLSQGVNLINLTYNWQQVYEREINDTLTLKDIYLENRTSGNILDREFYIYNTSNIYDYTEFESPEVLSFTITDYGEDIDGNGLYDYLVIELGNLSEGWYFINMDIENDYGDIFSAINSNVVYVNSSGKFGLKFKGSSINFLEKDSKYLISDIWINIESIDYHYEDYYNTSFYNYTEFEKPGFKIIGNFSDQEVDVDNNGVYDYLLIGFDVNITAPSEYIFRSTLVDSSGEIISENYKRSVFLDEGIHRINFEHNGVDIFQSSYSGSYALSDLTVVYEDAQFRHNYIYNTSFYNFTAFETDYGLEVIGPVTDFGLDTDGNGLYDYLVLELPINVSRETIISAYPALMVPFDPDWYPVDFLLKPGDGNISIYYRGEDFYNLGEYNQY